MFKLLQDCWVVLLILCFLCQFGELSDVMVYITTFHLEFVEFGSCFIMGLDIILVLDKILFEFFLDVKVWRG